MSSIMDQVLQDKTQISFRSAYTTKEGFVAALEEAEYAEEGIFKGILSEMGNSFVGAASEIKGWFEAVGTKKAHIDELADKLIVWLEKQDEKNPKMDLEMGTFKTWMKTNDFYYWRYFFILNDAIYDELLRAAKNDELTALEEMIDVEFANRRKVNRYLESAHSISDLIITVKKYKSRVDNIYNALLNRKTKIKGFPFQVMLLGLIDLKITLKKIVNLHGIL